jgi:TPR repeat protein
MSRTAAEKGLAEAQSNLGYKYETGRGVPQNDTEAANWYRRAAEQGLAAAQSNLGAEYETGQGVPQDYVLAYFWFSLAAAQSHQDAAKSRDMVAQRMTSAQIAEVNKVASEWKPTREW